MWVVGLGSLLWSAHSAAQSTNLRLQLSDGVQTATPGEGLTYQLSVFNDGPSDAPGVLVQDTFPSQLSCVWTCVGTAGANCTPGQAVGPIHDLFDLAAGSSAHYTALCDIAADANGTLSNTATVTAPGSVTDIDPNDNSASDLDTLLVPRYDLVLRKSDGRSSVRPGEVVTYSVTVDHSGSSDAVGVTVRDVLPAALDTVTWSCQPSTGSLCTAGGSDDLLDVVTLRSGGQLLYQLSGTVASDASGTLHNIASLTIPAGAVDTNISNNADSDNTDIEVVADLSVALSATPPIFIPGQSVTYTLGVANGGPADALGAQVVSPVPASLLDVTWTCAAGGGASCGTAGGGGGTSGVGEVAATVTLPVGGTLTYQITGSLDAAAVGSLSHSAQVSPPPGVLELDGSDNSATLSRPLQPTVDLFLTFDDGVATAVPGLETVYILEVANDGPSDAPAVPLRSLTPTSSSCLWTCQASGGAGCAPGPVAGDLDQSVHLPSGGQASFEGRCAIDPAATGQLIHSAELTVPAGLDDLDPADHSAVDTDLLTPQADVTVSKTDDLASLRPGGSSTYTITVRNPSGPSLARHVAVQDLFPESLTCTWTCQGSGGGLCNPGQVAGDIDDSVQLPVGGRVTYSAQCQLAADAEGTLINAVTATPPATLIDPNGSNNSALDSTDIEAVVDLAIQLTDGVAEATPGGTLTYTLTVDNLGTADAVGATVLDTFPAPLSCAWGCVASPGATCTAGQVEGPLDDTVDLPAGGQLVYTAQCDIAPGATGVLTNRASVEPPTGIVDLAPGNNEASDLDTRLVPRADLAISKSDGQVTAGPGGSLTYTISASNLSGPSDAVDATVSDPLPDVLVCAWSCAASGDATCTANPPAGDLQDVVQLPVGGLVTYTGQCSLAVDADGTLSNTATVTLADGSVDPELANNSATDTTTLVTAVDLALTLEDDGNEVVAGADVHYQISVTNLPTTLLLPSLWSLRPLPLAPAVDVVGAKVRDIFPNVLTCAWTCTASPGGVCAAGPQTGAIDDSVDLPAGAELTYDIHCQLAANAVGSLSNTATVTPPPGLDDSAPANNAATAQATVLRQADLRLSKSDGTTLAHPGDGVTYTLVASNADGPSDVLDAQVVDFFAPELTCLWSCEASDGASCAGGQLSGDIQDSVDLPVGSQVTYTALCAIDPDAQGSLANTADLLPPAGVSELDDGDNRASDLDTVLVPRADLVVTLSDGLTTAVPGTSLTYTVEIDNGGPSAVFGASVVDAFPPGLSCLWSCAPGPGALCTPGQVTGDLDDTFSLPVGGHLTYLATCDLAADLTGTLSNSAVVTLPEPGVDPVNSNNTASDDDTVLRPTADLILSKDDGVEVAHPGGSVTYQLLARNLDGPSAMAGVEISDPVPAVLSDCTWSCTASGGADCGSDLPSGDLLDALSLPVGGQVLYSGQCQISDQASGHLANTAHLTLPAGSLDPDLNDNSASDVDPLVALVDLFVDLDDGLAEAVAGETSTYRLEIGNRGPSPAFAAAVTVPVPDSLTCTWTCQPGSDGVCGAGPHQGTLVDSFDLAAQGTLLYDGQCRIDPEATEPLLLIATVTAPSGAQEADGSDNGDDDSTALRVEADLTISNSDGQDSALPGEEVVYAITVHNDGPSHAASAQVESLFPTVLSCVWSCAAEAGASCVDGQQSGDLSDDAILAPGSTLLYAATCQIDVNASGLLETVATVSLSSGLDPDPSNNQASDLNLLSDAADLALDLLDEPDPVAPGALLLYRARVSNGGPVQDGAVQVTVQLPAQVSFVSAFLGEPGQLFADGFESGDLSAWQPAAANDPDTLGGAGPCTQQGNTLSCDLGVMGPATALDLVVVVDVVAGNGATLVATATVEGSGSDADSSDNSASVITTVGDEAGSTGSGSAASVAEPQR